ncbi:GNAT family N-acetyltransferase [Streptomyces mirabilis]|uniref:GNAT family N-acetyltransferase n=1 Tax=Streptomyces mirabilis TaxID=68239 RepID=UPI00381EB8A5
MTTERLFIRPLKESDIDHITASWQDPVMQRWTAVPELATREQAKEFVCRFCPDAWRDGRHFIFGAEVRESGAFVGTLGIFGLSWVSLSEQLATVGYWTTAALRRKGYMAEGLRTLSRWAFTELHLDRLEAVVEVGNEASLACATKAGYQLEGRLRSRTIQNGTRRDAWLASLLPQDLGETSTIPYQAPDHT